MPGHGRYRSDGRHRRRWWLRAHDAEARVRRGRTAQVVSRDLLRSLVHQAPIRPCGARRVPRPGSRTAGSADPSKWAPPASAPHAPRAWGSPPGGPATAGTCARPEPPGRRPNAHDPRTQFIRGHPVNTGNALGIHRLLPLRARACGVAASKAAGTSNTDSSALLDVRSFPADHPFPSPVLRPLLTSARPARTSRCMPSARRHPQPDRHPDRSPR
jgi:hypothetical protein